MDEGVLLCLVPIIPLGHFFFISHLFMVSKKDKGKILLFMSMHFGSQKGCINIVSAYFRLATSNITQILQVRMDEMCVWLRKHSSI